MNQFWPSCVDRYGLPLTFQFDLHFRWTILANLKANWKTRGLTKPGNKIINHHDISTKFILLKKKNYETLNDILRIWLVGWLDFMAHKPSLGIQ